MSTIEQQVALLNTYKQNNINMIVEKQQSIDTSEATIQRNYQMNEDITLYIAQYEEEIEAIEANNIMLDEMIVELESLSETEARELNETE